MHFDVCILFGRIRTNISTIDRYDTVDSKNEFLDKLNYVKYVYFKIYDRAIRFTEGKKNIELWNQFMKNFSTFLRT